MTCLSCLVVHRGVSEDKTLEDLFIAPFAIPKAPQRFYYLFGKPIETSRADLDDPARVGQLYRQVSADSGFFLPSPLDQSIRLLRTTASPGVLWPWTQATLH